MVRVEGFEPSSPKTANFKSAVFAVSPHPQLVQGVGFEPTIRPLNLMVDYDSTVDNRSTTPAFIK